MKSVNALERTENVSREASRLCCLTRVNSLLKALRTQHAHADTAQQLRAIHDARRDDDGVSVPTPHDDFVSELEAAVAIGSFARLQRDTLVAFDSARELARVKLVFTATLAVPLVLVAVVLGLFGAQLDRAVTSLLQVSALALATPLILSLARTAVRSGWQGIRQHPWLALLGAAAAGGYASSAVAMTGPASATTSAMTLSVAGLLVMTVQLGHWWLVRRPVA
ncbi:hypothetical protein [Dokdonella immobilis]|uniref:Uncharacterized protein n=1 Tax=Dokdonella immobilis TaxID=578942 RepID=A0A1I4XHG5_9GAMM|nr:hypothetical protein [Dokdonella immobilis]SFN25132.1 hypothetical protein SAMN05216289_1106 [Dokdonella immobilis]